MRRTPRGFSCVALQRPKNSINVGSAIRAAQIYGAALLVTSGLRYRRVGADTMAGWKHVPLLEGVVDVFDHVPYDCVPVAVDIIDGARDLSTYTHPERAFYIFGPEDGTLGGETLKRCRDVIYVPTDGCMNLAAAVNVVLYDRLAKQRRTGRVE